MPPKMRRCVRDRDVGVDVLRGLDVPAYLLAIDFSDGSMRYRVYAGAYSDEREASYLQDHLRAHGLDDATLSTRVGRVPGVDFN